MKEAALDGLVNVDFTPHEPTPRQAAGLLLNHIQEVFYGGAAGGGKSDWLLMAALQYVDVPGYSALIVRKTFSQLTKADMLVPRSHEWLNGTSAVWAGSHMRWQFPSGATLEFGHMMNENDKYNYQGAAYQFIGFDELTQFSETQYRYLFSRARRLEDSQVPVRIRATSNPGGLGHDWVRQRMIIEGKESGRVFIPAKLQDNPYLDQEEYRASLMELDPITRARLLSGDWSIRDAGGLFKREWFQIVDAVPKEARRVRGWDFAATAPKAGTDPDWTVGLKMSRTPDGEYFIEDVRRDRLSPSGVEKLLVQTASLDGANVTQWLEQEPGSGGKIATAAFIKSLAGLPVHAERSSGDKATRAAPFSSQCEAGNVKILNGTWVSEFLDELEAFPAGSHDDQVDAASLSFGKLHGGSSTTWSEVVSANY